MRPLPLLVLVALVAAAVAPTAFALSRQEARYTGFSATWPHGACDPQPDDVPRQDLPGTVCFRIPHGTSARVWIFDRYFDPQAGSYEFLDAHGRRLQAIFFCVTSGVVPIPSGATHVEVHVHSTAVAAYGPCAPEEPDDPETFAYDPPVPTRGEVTLETW